MSEPTAKPNARRPVWITGIGLLSAAGEGNDAHRAALAAGTPAGIDREICAPYAVHALAAPDWSTQISRRDMRQMEPWQRIGTYAAGLALDDADAKHEDLLDRMDMIVAAGGGERDVEVDSAILKEARGRDDKAAVLNERLPNDLRPTLFLAQLSNLLAGNISIVHKVTGSSRTFMGEEGAGISAIQVGHARVASGQSDIMLVGGAFNAERMDMHLFFEMGHMLSRADGSVPVGKRTGKDSGFHMGSIGAFLVLEDADHARARGAKPYGVLETVDAQHGGRGAGRTAERLALAVRTVGRSEDDVVLSGATGLSDLHADETGTLGHALQFYGTVFGHGVEAQFPLGVALAALGDLPTTVVGVGAHRAEGAARVVPVTEGDAR